MNIFKIDLLAIAMVLLAVIVLCDISHAAEFDYTKKWCVENGGDYGSKKGVYMKDGTYADCITATHAVEFDWCEKWMECAAQAENYAVLTNKKALCVLICSPSSKDTYLARYRRSQLKTCISRRTEVTTIEK